MIGFYERYVRVLFERYGRRVKYWLTFNEINSVLHAPLLSGAIWTPKDLSLIHISPGRSRTCVATPDSTPTGVVLSHPIQSGSLAHRLEALTSRLTPSLESHRSGWARSRCV